LHNSCFKDLFQQLTKLARKTKSDYHYNQFSIISIRRTRRNERFFSFEYCLNGIDKIRTESERGLLASRVPTLYPGKIGPNESLQGRRPVTINPIAAIFNDASIWDVPLPDSFF
jgi:hypothetical protein